MEVDMSNLKRYRFDEVYNSGLGAVEDKNGCWVKFDDIKEFLPTATNSQSKPCLVHGDHVHSHDIIICDACGEKL
jgi:hypothetical protein